MNQPVCVVFAGRQGLDNNESRYSIARIPEVSACLREAQSFFDNLSGIEKNIDLFSFLSSSDSEFAMQPQLRSLVAAIVQVGLFRRYTKFYGSPDFMIGNDNGASALNVCSGTCSLTEMISASPFTKKQLKMRKDSGPHSLIEDFTLSGLSLEEYSVLKRSETDYSKVQWPTKNCYGILKNLQQEFQVEQFIHIGPHFDFRSVEFEKAGLTDFSMTNSTEMDPILNSFWKTA